MYQTRLFHAKPSPLLVMNAWTRCGKIERAERILKDMEESFYNGSTEGRIAPNVVSYTTLMNG